MHSKLEAKIFILPLIISVFFIAGYLWGFIFYILSIGIGIGKITIDSYEQIKRGKYSLDYIAFIAMVMSLTTGQYLTGVVIAFMFTGGEALEAFASERAHDALEKLGNTIPKKCLVKKNESFIETPIQQIKNSDVILVKRKEIIPLDGILESNEGAFINFANLTGESETLTIKKGTLIKSGSINEGDSILLIVQGDFSTSTYHKIISLVESAKLHPAHTVRLSERANIYFTLITFVLAFITFFLTQDITRLLAVLVLATPCPLIIAAPVAFISGMSKAARSQIIIKNPEAFEVIDKAKIIFFDKTGTLTLGTPKLQKIEIISPSKKITNEKDALSFASSVEIHSLHPLAKAILKSADEKDISYSIAVNIKETIGKGIEGLIQDTRIRIESSKENKGGIVLSLYEDDIERALFHFADVIKPGTELILEKLKRRGIHASILTGDKEDNAKEIFKDFNIPIHAELTPENKFTLIKSAQKNGELVIMVGDGLNDAPALAQANTSIVFSGTDNTASIEAAQVSILGNDVQKIATLINNSHKTIRIAKQSIYGGIGLSIIGMIFASFGMIPPFTGAILQEAVDVVVILNALRALA